MVAKPVSEGVIAWFSADDYPRIRGMAADQYLLPADYQEWRERANRNIAWYEEQGTIVRKVLVRPAELAAFCRRRKLPCDARARSECAQELAAKG
ncbi:MAG TPA: hypothetical protein VHG30_14655 [Microvirga sp.]|nr:hypothetical protein [Microvirga sp.]